jgi:drug/metabolite transporter (DMT)-like permease
MTSPRGRAARRQVAGRTAGRTPDDTVLLLLALYACWGSAIPAMKLMVELRPARWSEVSLTSIGAGFLLVFDSLIGFMLYTRLLASAPAPLVSTYACVTPIVGVVLGMTVLDESVWAGAFVGAALVLTAVALELRAG